MEDDSKNKNSVLAEVMHAKIGKMLECCKVKEQNLDILPKVFLQFLKERGLDHKELSVKIPRYVRVKPEVKISTEELAAKIGIKNDEIVQVQQYFWAINPDAKINHCELYKSALLYGMDYSSALPVKCMQIQPKNRILELCCAPGNKSMLMADHNKDVRITGVEINVNRVNVMKSLVKKYKLDQQIQVVTEDGLKYDSAEPFDRVLVDAECTHEGSVKHIFKFFKEEVNSDQELKHNKKLTKQQQKQFQANNSNPYTSQIQNTNKWTKQDFQQRFLDHFKLSQLNKLQYGLLENGFRLVKEGGIVVYSTCSFDQQQNQDIVRQFLNRNKNAQLLDATEQLQCSVGWKYGTIKGTIRLSPSISYCGGMFVAKLMRKAGVNE